MKLFEISDNKVIINIPLKTRGKFRWKNRKSIDDYGNGFSTMNLPYTENSYVEWQIGYDVETSKIDEKPTTLTNITFKGDNNKIKHPYELSEILYAMLNANIITKSELKSLLDESSADHDFLDKVFKINIKNEGNYTIGDLVCHKQSIALPTFIYKTKSEEVTPTIEISIQKQQYATGVQPMLYFSIPILCLKNGNELIGKTSKQLTNSYGQFVIDKSNKTCILDIFKLFSCCSKRHKYDINSILKLLMDY